MRERTIVVRLRCLNPECHRDAQHRGLCNPCYQQVRRRIKSGKYQEEELEARGKLLRTSIDKFLESN